MSIWNNAIFDFRKLLGRWRLSKSLIDYHLKLPSITFSPKIFFVKTLLLAIFEFLRQNPIFSFFIIFVPKHQKKKSVFFSLYKWKKSVKLGFQNWKKLGQKMEVWNSVQSWLLKFLTLISKDIQVSHSWHRTFKRTPNWFSRYRKFHTHFLTIYHWKLN